MGELLEARRKETARRIERIRSELKRAEALCLKRACVFVTGSFGRGEASQHSDLDLFIAGEALGLSRLNQILVKADLIEAMRDLRFPPFSGDGEYLTHYTVDDLVKTLGKREDDVTNAFTARLLLILESRPLLEANLHRQIIRKVIDAYWRDYKGHEKDFAPGFLANDILRLWRTFCVNYEAGTSTEPERKRAKRRLKNYKLKHSRLLTCYSALLYLLAIYSRRKTVAPSDAGHMAAITPGERLEWLLQQRSLRGAHSGVKRLVLFYEQFLRNTDEAEDMMIDRFMNPKARKRYAIEQHKFGDMVFRVLNEVGRGNRFHRLLVV